MENGAKTGTLGNHILSHFCLQRQPFPGSVEDYPFFPCQHHLEVLGGTEKAVADGQTLIQITGEPGTGKTRLWLEASRRCDRACDWVTLLAEEVWEKGLPAAFLARMAGPNSAKGEQATVDTIAAAISGRASSGRRPVIVFDAVESLQSSPYDIIDELSEALRHASASVILIDSGRRMHTAQAGRPGALAHSFHLQPFTQTETFEFIHHCVAAAGGFAERVFTDDAMAALHRFTGGNARLISTLADASMLQASSEQAPLVTEGIVVAATQFVNLPPERWFVRTHRLLGRIKRALSPRRGAPFSPMTNRGLLGPGHTAMVMADEPKNQAPSPQAPNETPEPATPTTLPVRSDAVEALTGALDTTVAHAPTAAPSPAGETSSATPHKTDRLPIGFPEKLRLIGVRGGFTGACVQIRLGDVITVGRSRDCDLSLWKIRARQAGTCMDEARLHKVSRFHATVSYTKRGVVVQDHSSNGTFVNGKRVKEHVLIRNPGLGSHKIALGSKQTILLLKP